MSESPAKSVRHFHETFGYPISDTPVVPNDGLKALRRTLIREEADELDSAVEADDLVGVAHELGDIVYVAYGTALTYGIDLDKVIDEIHRANMTKERRVTTGKAVKGSKFVAADVKSVLFDE